MTKTPTWHDLVTVDVLFNNLTTGLFLVTAVAELVAPETFSRVARVAYPIALVLLLIDLLCLVLDLGDPLRFHHMLRVFKPSSPMSLGTWCLTVYSLPLTVVAGMSVLPGDWGPPEWVRQVIVAAGILPALGSAVYKGVLFSTTSQPGWKDARWFGGYLTNSAVMLGCAGLLALSVLLGRGGAASMLMPVLIGLLLLNAAFLWLLVNDIGTALISAHGRMGLYRLGAIVLGLGVFLPLGLLLVGGTISILGALLFVVFGALVVRRVLVFLPHRVAFQPGR